MEDKARYVAVKTLFDIESKGAYSNLKLNYYFKKYELEPSDRGFSTEILYGTIRWKKRLDYIIKKFSKIKIKKISVWTLCCIRTAIYEIYFLDRVPDFATVNQAVEMTKVKEPRDASFVNGILRTILRNRDEFYNIKIQNKIQKMAVEYSQEEWFVQKLIKDFGEKTAKNIMEKSNKTPMLTLRVNTLKTSREYLSDILIEKGCKVELGKVQDSIKVKGLSSLEKSEEFLNGLFTVQDESSMLAAICLSPNEGDKVIDLCSAPGGKSTYMAQIMKNIGEINSFDIHEHKLNLIKDSAERLGINIIKEKLFDSTIFNEEYLDYADKVLVDVPCSGLGIIRKKPEIRWNIKEEDIISLTKIQREILKNASKYVKPKGEIVYSTCTITKEENEDIIEDFLKENNNFEMVDISEFVPFNIDSAKKGYIKLLPGIYDTDGFFIAKLRRKR
ncbi:16S rRNA (cytosine(967)-C(5))-methyltransferase RsmB [Clostridium cylindrosporum]|uniref:16S rRNA (cytosine(967)-C(5))-methyltransferase n=1 Tax=Clostridium cylindrosporum DSM 605 TaxID=1121307 RepID=A0A0J8DAY2_CLOCY|nr:16S rRNA (cytosine(967)-C(5))-methyltransferase RsmB [Clostridium cylindrosporum]KMT21453.1 ribosomal RNA small subunit methyltransferase B [Clostridium cylindrosporum DSM 605]